MFFTTFAHAVAKAAERVFGAAKTALPVAQAALPVVEGLATAADPTAAPVIEAMGNAANALLGHAISVVSDEAQVEAALKTGTLTLPIGVEAIQDLKAMVPAATQMVQAIGLGHTVPATAAKTN